jgi:mandelamide amidase
MDDSVAQVIDTAVAILEDAGAVIVDADLPNIIQLTAKAAWPISAYETVEEIYPYLKRRGTSLTLDEIVMSIASPIVRERFHPNTENLADLEPAYRKAMDEYRPELQRILNDYFTGHDVAAMIFPTTPFPAPQLIDETANDYADVIVNGKTVKGGLAHVINNTVHQSASGIPSLVVPAGLTDTGLPVGLSLDGPLGADRRLLAIGQAFERVRGPYPAPPGVA